MSEPRERLESTVHFLEQVGVPCKHWEEKLQHNANMHSRRDAVALVILLPGNGWECELEQLPGGCEFEMADAKLREKDVYLSYESSSGRKIYKIDEHEFQNYDNIAGLAHSTPEAVSELRNLTKPSSETGTIVAVDTSTVEYKYKLIKMYDYHDRRLLLLY